MVDSSDIYKLGWVETWRFDAEGRAYITYPADTREEGILSDYRASTFLLSDYRASTFLLFSQETYWMDQGQNAHKLAEMEYSYVRNIIHFLHRNADHWRRRVKRDLWMYVSDAEYQKVFDGETLKKLWLLHQMLEDEKVMLDMPLVRALEAEKERRINDPKILEMLKTDTERELYYQLVADWPEEPESAAIIARDNPAAGIPQKPAENPAS